MASLVLSARREKIAAYMNMTCLLCNKLLKEAITISFCRHSFCRKCIYEKLSDRGFKSCPLCDISLGCIPVDKLRPDHNLQNIRANIFPVKRRKIEALEVSSSVNTKERSLLSSVSTPILPMQVAHTLPTVTDEVANKGEFRAIIWNEPSIMKKRRLEEILEGSKKRADYHPSWNLRTEGGRLLLDMACRLVQSTVPPEISNELMTKLLPDICKWMQYRFANCKEIGLLEPKLVDKEAAHMKQCDEIEQNLCNLKSDHHVKLKKQADFYESKLKEQVQQYEAEVKSLENEVNEKRTELLHRRKQLEQLNEVIKRKYKLIEMLFQLTGDVGIRLKETITCYDEAGEHSSALKEQANMIAELKEQAQHPEATVESLENEVIDKRKEIFAQSKQLEKLHEVVKRKDKSIEMLFPLTEHVRTRLEETLTSLDQARVHIGELEEQVKMIPKLKKESHRAGMEEGVKRVVRAVQAASPYVDWDQIHVSENTPDEDRDALQRAFVEGITTAPSLATQDEDQGRVIIL